jgi:hypothetical protein
MSSLSPLPFKSKMLTILDVGLEAEAGVKRLHSSNNIVNSPFWNYIVTMRVGLSLEAPSHPLP